MENWPWCTCTRTFSDVEVKAIAEPCVQLLAFDQVENLGKSWTGFLKDIMSKPTLKIRSENLDARP